VPGTGDLSGGIYRNDCSRLLMTSVCRGAEPIKLVREPLLSPFDEVAVLAKSDGRVTVSHALSHS
jgi:hypothetical protein